MAECVPCPHVKVDTFYFFFSLAFESELCLILKSYFQTAIKTNVSNLHYDDMTNIRIPTLYIICTIPVDDMDS